MSRVRNAAIAVSENMACYENLANAIILQAVKDYKWALHRLDVNPKKSTRSKAKNIVQYMMLIGLDKSGQKSDIYHTARQERRKPKGEI